LQRGRAADAKDNRGVRKWPLVGVAVLLLAGLGGLALVTYSAVELRRFERGEVRRATAVYAAPLALVPGVNVRRVDLAGTLARLRYVETRGTPASPGQFRRGAGAWEIFLRGLDGPGGSASRRVRIELSGDRVTKVTRDGQPIGAVLLEPEVLTSVGDRPGEDFRPLRLADAPFTLINAVLAAEDHRFFEHRGIDARGLFRAAWANLRAGRVTQGGSTITQQLVKNRLLDARRTLARKLDEAWLAALVEWRYSKPQILEAYLNEIYLGQRGALAVRGVGAAARSYFGKEVHQLTLAESATLAGMLRAPNGYSPAVDPARSRARRNVILGRMHELGVISEAQREAASREPMRVQPATTGGQVAPYFTDHVRLELEQRLGDEIAGSAGARVFTSLDVALQRAAEEAVARGLERLEQRVPRLRRAEPGARLQAALVALDPATGRIRALVGGRDYQASQFNRATRARRQPGSAFKPLVYLAALRGLQGDRPAFTPASLVDDTPVTLTVDGQPWTPRNYEDRYEGRVTVRRALEQSLNAATVRLAQAVGPAAVVDTARALGVVSPLAPVPALALGAFEVTPLELAAVYVPLAAGGLRPDSPTAVEHAWDGGGDAIDLERREPAAVISPAEAYLMTSLLEGVLTSGTGAGAGLPARGALAGKTGTTNDGRDAWFVGYSTRLVTAVWVGFDDNEPHGLGGAQAALPIWVEFMRHAAEAYATPAFTVPGGITHVNVDPTTGKQANRFCPLVAREVFLAGTEPEPCDEHGGVSDQVIDWWRRFRDWFRR
jgi:penicillin-binding protein 1B